MPLEPLEPRRLCAADVPRLSRFDILTTCDGASASDGSFVVSAEGMKVSGWSIGRTYTLLARYTASGRPLWQHAFRLNYAAHALPCTVGPDGTIYFAFSTTGNPDLDPSDRGLTLNPTGGTATYVLSFTPAGSLRWARVFTGDVQISDLAATSHGVILSGRFRGSFDADPGPAVARRSSAGGFDGLALSLNRPGKLEWARRFGGAGDDFADALAVVPGGDTAYLAGRFTGRVPFAIDGSQTLTSPGKRQSTYVAALLDKTGVTRSAAALIPTGTSYPDAICADPAGNVTVVGSFHGTIDVDPSPTGTRALTSTPSVDESNFVARLAPDLSFRGSARIGGTGTFFLQSAAAANDGSVYLAGDLWNGAVDFAALGNPPITASLASHLNTAALLARLAPDGSFTYVQTVEGEANFASAAFAGGNTASLLGSFSHHTDLNPGPAYLDPGTDTGAFLLTLGPTGAFRSAHIL